MVITASGDSLLYRCVIKKAELALTLPKLCPTTSRRTLQDRTEPHGGELLTLCKCTRMSELGKVGVGLRIWRGNPWGFESPPFRTNQRDSQLTDNLGPLRRWFLRPFRRRRSPRLRPGSRSSATWLSPIAKLSCRRDREQRLLVQAGAEYAGRKNCIPAKQPRICPLRRRTRCDALPCCSKPEPRRWIHHWRPYLRS